MLACKLAASPLEYADVLARWPDLGGEPELDRALAERGLRIETWSAADVGADLGRVGLAGSPTKVLQVAFVTLESSASRTVDASPQGMAGLVHELVREYIL